MRTKKHNLQKSITLLFFTFTISLFLFTNCKKDETPDPTLTISEEEIALELDAGFKTINVFSNVDWTASSDESWLTVAPQSGSKDGQITATATENTEIEERTAIITITGSTLTQTVKVTQKSITPSITIDKNTVAFEKRGGGDTINITANVDWTASSDKSWLTIAPNSGSNDGYIIATAIKSDEVNARTGTITIISGKITKTVEITQEPFDPNEIDVLDFRTSADDREMIQKAIDHAFTNKIGIVAIPDGEYEIEVTTPRGILLHDNIHLKLSKNAVLKALPSSSANYSVVRIHNAGNVIISGGTILGERDEHNGTTGEWGHGIDIWNSTNVEMKDISIKNCWGDGIYITAGSEDVLMSNVICDNNRRQGLSVINVNGLIIKDCVFKNTHGTHPQSGIDFEPNPNSKDSVTNVLIENCSFLNNAGRGLLLVGAYGTVTNIKAVNCIMDNNPVGVSLRFAGATKIDLSDLKIINSATDGLQITEGANDVNISNVNIENSTTRSIRLTDAVNIKLSGFKVNGYSAEGILIERSTDVKMSSSTFETAQTTAIGCSIIDSKSVELSDLKVNGYSKDGILINRSTDVKVSSSSFETTKKKTAIGCNIIASKDVELSILSFKGGMMGVSSLNTETIELSGSTFELQVKNGLYLAKTSSSKIHGNSFKEIEQTPVNVFYSNNNKIYNNTFSNNCFLTDDKYSQIYFQGTSQDNDFNDNTISKSTLPNKAKYGVWLTSGTLLNKVFNNTIDAESYRQSAIKDEGESNEIN